ncbi:hypothetical protein [Sphingomonas bacterium]|uniref:hypothetical protein n=1 Tax=Sphingomonas bacterium TaxID=1895847 RepID=UPI0026122032|nr:hypothetical protein [Sphingomonas bacterium]MDB5679128.1 hypothetical protein [Sphingomonas bacterium]
MGSTGQKEAQARARAARVTRHGKDGPQVVAVTAHRWTDEAEAAFLDTLAASCNVTLSAATAGFSTEAIYRRRRTDPVFAERWQAALEQGYARIEMAVVARAGDAMEGFAPDPDSPIPAMTVQDAIAILKLHGPAVRGEGRAPGWRARPRSLDEVRDSILTKLEAIDAARREAGE